VSGFFGILRSDGQDISRGLLERITKVLRFRGPHDESILTQPGLGCCFTFLETGPAKQAARQPVMLGPNWIIGDMRIDAREDLIRELVKRGAQVSNDPTSEDLLLHACQIWGEHCLQRVIGDFAEHRPPSILR
jgi:asparagine synthetase B (glutamine-hydrolysing)